MFCVNSHMSQFVKSLLHTVDIDSDKALGYHAFLFPSEGTASRRSVHVRFGLGDCDVLPRYIISVHGWLP